MSREDSEAALDEACAKLGDDEIRTLVYIAERLLEGQWTYGRLDLASDGRDWKKERAQELADLLVYTAFEALKQETVS